MKPPVALLALLLLPLSSARAETPGRLFFTPAERTRIDHLLDTAASDHSAPRGLDGMVSRSDGRHTLFLDGKPTPPGPGARRTGPTTARLTAADGRSHELRVGERLPADSPP
mgnify:FL=1